MLFEDVYVNTRIKTHQAKKLQEQKRKVVLPVLSPLWIFKKSCSNMMSDQSSTSTAMDGKG